jgi:hypothetical protein
VQMVPVPCVNTVYSLYLFEDVLSYLQRSSLTKVYIHMEEVKSLSHRVLLEFVGLAPAMIISMVFCVFDIECCL